MKVTTWTTVIDDNEYKRVTIRLLNQSLGRTYRGQLLEGWKLGGVFGGRRLVVVTWVPYTPKKCRINGVCVLLRHYPVNWYLAFCLWLLSWVCTIRTEGV